MSNSDEIKSFKDLSENEQKERIVQNNKLAAKVREGVHGKSEYYSWNETIDDIKEANGAAETAVAGSKWAGKSLFNIGKFALGTAVPAVMEQVTKTLEDSVKKKK